MATTLLLEGDDLELLLERAHAEGGPAARIVRAEKIRHGGVLGFFAKERFEVALEIPDRPHHASDDSTTKGPTMSETTIDTGLETTIDTRLDTAIDTGRTRVTGTSRGQDQPRDAYDRLTRRLVAAAGDSGVAAVEGLLGLAERADAAERAAGRPGSPDAVAAQGTSPTPRIPAPRHADSSTEAPDALDVALRRLLEQRDPEPAYPTASPVRPSTTRPEFTALLDQLRLSTSSTPAGRPATSGPAPEPAAVLPAPIPAAYKEAAMAPSPSGAPAPAASATSQVPAPAVPAPSAPAPVERQTLGRSRAAQGSTGTRDRREDPQLAADRGALRALGVPVAWTRQLRPGDRFTAVLRMLDRMPDVDIDPATRVVAVVGPSESVLLEAHRTALDLPIQTGTGTAPRPVISIPATPGAERAGALAEARLLGDVVVAIHADDEGHVPAAVEALQVVGAGAVIAIVSAADGIERSQSYLDALGQVDALSVEGTAASSEPAAVLQLGLPVVRLDGIPIDRYTWTAVLCAQLGPVAGQ